MIKDDLSNSIRFVTMERLDIMKMLLAIGFPEIEGTVSECLSGIFVCVGRGDTQCRVRQPSGEQEKRDVDNVVYSKRVLRK